MEGTPVLALHLLQLGNSLALRGLDRAVALAFTSAAQIPRISPRVAAHALYKAAFHLNRSATNSFSDEEAKGDRRRALELLRKCYLLIRTQPSCFSIRMQIFALVEKLYTQSGNHHKAATTIDRGLSTITSQSADRQGALLWWVYLRGRAVSNALAAGKSCQQALSIASQSAEQCASHGDSLAAVAFYAAQFQIALGNTNPKLPADIDMRHPKAILNAFRPANRRQIIDKATLDVAIHIFETLMHLRVGHTRVAHNQSIDPLLASYRRLREVVKSDVTATGSWIWLAPKLLSTITNNIVSLVAQEDTHRRSQAAIVVCLKRLRLYENKQISPYHLRAVSRDNQISQCAGLALSLTILDNAARLHLAHLELPQAAVYIKAAAHLAFPNPNERRSLQTAEQSTDVDLSPLLKVDMLPSVLKMRSVVFLLFAEYHCLRGILPGAEASMRYLTALCDVPNKMHSEFGEVWLSDTVQAAASHLSLLTGEKRRSFDPKTVGQLDASDGLLAKETSHTDFTNQLIYAAALLTDGVFYMRLEKVVEASRNVSRAIDISRASRVSNNQVTANALAIRSAPGLIHQILKTEPFKDIAESIEIATQLEDPIMMARATRQRRRLVVRANMSQQDMRAADVQLQRAHMAVSSKQNLAPLIL